MINRTSLSDSEVVTNERLPNHINKTILTLILAFNSSILACAEPQTAAEIDKDHGITISEPQCKLEDINEVDFCNLETGEVIATRLTCDTNDVFLNRYACSQQPTFVLADAVPCVDVDFFKNFDQDICPPTCFTTDENPVLSHINVNTRELELCPFAGCELSPSVTLNYGDGTFETIYNCRSDK